MCSCPDLEPNGPKLHHYWLIEQWWNTRGVSVSDGKRIDFQKSHRRSEYQTYHKNYQTISSRSSYFQKISVTKLSLSQQQVFMAKWIKSGRPKWAIPPSITIQNMIQVKVNYLVDGTFWCFSWRKSISKLLGEYIYHSFKITKDVNLASTLLNSSM